jgi:cell wall-associated NlpC family hydrolase
MHKESKEIKSRDLSEGDLVFFKINAKKVSHVGVYLKEGWFAHVSTSKGVMINNLSEAYYQKHYTSSGRVK